MDLTTENTMYDRQGKEQYKAMDIPDLVPPSNGRTEITLRIKGVPMKQVYDLVDLILEVGKEKGLRKASSFYYGDKDYECRFWIKDGA